MKKKKVIIIIACVISVVIAVSAFLLFSLGSSAEDSTRVSIDCSVSIEFSVSSSSKVQDIIGIDNYAKELLEDNEIVNKNINEASKIIFKALAEENYISKTKNTIILSSQKSSHSENILNILSFNAQEIFPQNDIQPCILIQEVTIGDTITNISDNYGISFGKARFVHQIIKQDIRYTIDDLANLSANELNIITLSGDLQLEDVKMYGLCNNSSYITSKDAVNESLSNAKIWETDVTDLNCSLDVINGRPVYRVLFEYEGILYEYEIDSKSGALLYHEKSNDNNLLNEINTLQYYSLSNDPDKAKYKPLLVAANHAGIKVANVTNYFESDETVADSDKQKISFYCDGYEYTYSINSKTNEIMDYSKKKRYANSDIDEYTFEKNENGFIGVDNASVIAFNHAGINTDDVINYVSQIIKSRDVIYYEISFAANGYNYSYMINAKTSEIIKYEKYKFN